MAKKKTTNKSSSKKYEANTIPKKDLKLIKYPEMNDRRLAQIRFMMEDQKLDAMVVTYLPNIKYLTNFPGSNAALFVLPDELHFITDDRYAEAIKNKELYDLPNMTVHISRDFWEYSKKSGIIADIKHLGFEADRVPYSHAVDIRNVIRPVKFKPAPNEVERFTMSKADEELANIKKACEISEKVYKKMLKKIKPGMTEIEAQTELIYTCRQEGSEGEPFEPIVLSGARTSMPHGRPSDKKIEKNDLITLDFGCKVNGFGSDITRTFVIGKATKEQEKVYELLVKAKDKAIKETRPGMNGNILDEYARDIIKDAGYGENFQHSLGHGLGVVTHESPILTFRKEEEMVPEGAVLSIEPGVYFEGKWGMRVEDNILVTVSGAEEITKAPKKLPTV